MWGFIVLTNRLPDDIQQAEVDTVCFALPAAYGRLMGKRYDAAHVRSHPDMEIRISELVLACDARMGLIPELSGTLASGHGDILLMPDWETARQLPWARNEAIVICDAALSDRTLIEIAPRTILKTQIARLHHVGLNARMASELEFYLLEPGPDGGPSSHERLRINAAEHCPDNHLLRASRHEPVIRQMRQALTDLSIDVEYSKSEGGRGQYEIVIGHAEPLVMADRHALYKYSVKEIARRNGLVATFIPKLSEYDDGSGGHVHCSLQDADGKSRATGTDPASGLPPMLARFLAGLCTTSGDFCAFFTPTTNAYKRLNGGALAPTESSWSLDDRTSALRVIGSGPNRRVENRIPGADMNPYLAFGAILAGGLTGIERDLSLPEPSWRAPLPHDLRNAVERFAMSADARKAFGETVVEFYARLIGWEVDQASRSVSDWERSRYLVEV